MFRHGLLLQIQFIKVGFEGFEISSTELDTSLKTPRIDYQWNRIDYNNRSQLSSLLQYFPLTKFTYYNRYLNAVTPFEIIVAISIYIIVVAMRSIEHESCCESQLEILKKGARKNV